MAAKRTPSKKPAGKKPVVATRTVTGQFVKAPVTTPGATAKDMVKPGVRETVIRRANVVAQPSPAEMRAEREPAVDVALSESLRGNRATAPEPQDEWAPPPQQNSWWERVRMALGLRREKQAEANENMAEHMAMVKAGVLQELETMGVKKGIAVKGSPFSNILLPVARPRRNWKWPLVIAAIVLLVGMMVWVGSKPDAPEAVLGQAMAAARNHDVRTFEAKVDVASVATSLVNQMFNVPEGTGQLAAKMTAFAKPGLADGLKDEILAAVGGEVLDDSGNTLLGKLWHAMGAGEVRFGAPRVAMQDPHMAVAELPVMRNDLGLNLPLQVVLTQGTAGHANWQVVDLPNLAAVLDNITTAEGVLAARRASVAVPENIRVESVKKAKDGGAGSSNLMVSMVLANVGTTDAKDVQLELAFGDAAGQPMMTTRVTLDGVLAAGSRREQVWSIPIDRQRAAERYVVDLPLSALTVVVSVVK